MSILTLLLGSVVAFIGLLVMLLHPVGPALALLAITPFDAIPFALFGAWGNAITYVPVLILVLLASPSRWAQIFLGTRLQQMTVLLMLVLVIPHVMSVDLLGLGIFQAYGRKATQFVLLGLFSWSMLNPKNVPTLVRVLLVSMSLWLLLSFADFYLGIQVLPVDTGEFESGALGVEFEGYLSGSLRFSGAGTTVNRTGSWQILPTLLAVGLWVNSNRRIDKLIVAGSVVVMGLAVMATVSRSATLGILLGLCILAPMALRVKVHQLVLGLLVVGIVGSGVYAGSRYIAADQNVETRWEPRALGGAIKGRFSRVIVGLEIWADNPVFGVGIAGFKKHSDVLLSQRGDQGGRGAHNSYTEVLAETGLLGFIPFMLVTFMAFRQFLIPVKRDFPEVDFWRPYFFAGFVGYLACNWFSGYHWQRLYWFSIAYAVVLERYAAAAMQKRRQEALEAVRQREQEARVDVPV